MSKLKNDKHKKAKRYYVRGSHSLCELRVGEFVDVQPGNSKHMWEIGKVVLQYAPRSYVVEVDRKLLTRNRKFLRTTSESPKV